MSTAYFIKPANGRVRPAVKIANSLGIKVKSVPRDFISGCSGVTQIVDNKETSILVANDLSTEEKRLTITHELAHIFLGHLLAPEDEHFEVSYEQGEFEAESLGFILYNFLYGIDGGRKPL